MEHDAAHLVMRDCFAAKAFLFQAANLAIAFAAKAIREIEVGASEGTAAHVNSFPKINPLVTQRW